MWGHFGKNCHLKRKIHPWLFCQGKFQCSWKAECLRMSCFPPWLCLLHAYILSCVCVCALVFEKKKIFKTLSPPNLMLKSFLPSEPFTSAWMHCLYLLAYLNWKLKPPCNELDPFFTLSIFTSVKKKEQNYIIYIKCMLYIFISIFF